MQFQAEKKAYSKLGLPRYSIVRVRQVLKVRVRVRVRVRQVLKVRVRVIVRVRVRQVLKVRVTKVRVNFFPTFTSAFLFFSTIFLFILL